MNKNLIKNRISAGLSHFGLNPEDWKLQESPSTKSTIIIFQNIADEKFQLQGQLNLTTKNPKLVELQLFSI